MVLGFESGGDEATGFAASIFFLSFSKGRTEKSVDLLCLLPIQAYCIKRVSKERSELTLPHFFEGVLGCTAEWTGPVIREFFKGSAFDGLIVFIIAHVASPHCFGLPNQDKPIPFATKTQRHEEIPEWFCGLIKPSLCLSDFVADNKKSERVVSRVLSSRFPGSDDHLSGPSIARRHERPTRKSRTGRPYPPPTSSGGDASLCGLAPGGVCQALPVTRESGELLPHRFTLTPFGAVFFSVALSMGSPPVPFRDRLALRSSDFPPSGNRRAIISPALNLKTEARSQKTEVRRKHCTMRFLLNSDSGS